MNSSSKAASIILPVYNEAANIPSLVERLAAFARGKPDWEFIYVDDGSTDATVPSLRESISRCGLNNISLLENGRNTGKGYVVRQGVYRCKGRVIGFTDGDLPYELDLFEEMVAKLEASHIVIAERSCRALDNREVPLSRRVLGWGYNLLCRRLFDLPYHDMQAGIKAFRKAVALDLFSVQRINGFSFDVELLFIAKKRGWVVDKMPVTVVDEHAYKLSKVKLTTDTVSMLYETLMIFFRDVRGCYEKKDSSLL